MTVVIVNALMLFCSASFSLHQLDGRFPSYRYIRSVSSDGCGHSLNVYKGFLPLSSRQGRNEQCSCSARLPLTYVYLVLPATRRSNQRECLVNLYTQDHLQYREIPLEDYKPLVFIRYKARATDIEDITGGFLLYSHTTS